MITVTLVDFPFRPIVVASLTGATRGRAKGGPRGAPGRRRSRKEERGAVARNTIKCLCHRFQRDDPRRSMSRRSIHTHRSHLQGGLPLCRGGCLGPPSPRSGEGVAEGDGGVWQAGRLGRQFAETFVQAVWRRSSGPHPIRRFAPPSPASWGRDPRGDLRCVNTAARGERIAPLNDGRANRVTRR